MKDQGFGNFASLPCNDERFSPALLYQFIKNFDAAKKSTMVKGQVISLDREVLGAIFRLPEGQHKVEQRLNNVQGDPYQPRGFDTQAVPFATTATSCASAPASI